MGRGPGLPAILESLGEEAALCGTWAGTALRCLLCTCTSQQPEERRFYPFLQMENTEAERGCVCPRSSSHHVRLDALLVMLFFNDFSTLAYP